MEEQKMNSIYDKIRSARDQGKKLLAVLLDPDKLKQQDIPGVISGLSPQVDFLFVGGSTVKDGMTHDFVKSLKKATSLPVVLFPGDYSQISPDADAVLFLSLISGRNPEYLIEQQVKAVPLIKATRLEVIPTGYLLIDGGVDTAVQQVSQTRPLRADDIKGIVNTACAGMYSGKKVIYLEAGSGAISPISQEAIASVRDAIDIPLIVGGGIRSLEQLTSAYEQGADLVVIGTAFEENHEFLKRIARNEGIH